jgi:RES domain
MKPAMVGLPDGRVWLRVADPDWVDPLDPSWAGERGGRWNPPGSFPVLYLNGDVSTARARIERMLAGSPVMMDDLDDDAYVLVDATLPRAQICADAVTSGGLSALGLPDSYPRGSAGEEVARSVCQRIGSAVHALGLRGVWCRSASTADGSGRELAWFPATARSRARGVWATPLALGTWRDATGWTDLGLEPQPEPGLLN